MINRSTLLATVVGGACLVALPVVTAAPAAAASHREVHLGGGLAAAGSGASFVSYDPELAPLGARINLAVVDAGSGRTQVALDADGLLPHHAYSAHAHVNPCGAEAADAGGHFQNRVDPAATSGTPSTDPAYANPQNEVWLDLPTDGSGAGHGEADVPFAFGTRAPRSVVVHEGGMTGPRVACITLPGS